MSQLESLRSITASALERIIACPGSEALPHIRRASPWSEMGDARHLYLQHVGEVGVENALALVPKEHRDMCETIDLEGMPTSLASEVTFAWNWKTGKARELGRALGRDYSGATENEIVGTIDALGVSADRLYIGDYKGFALVDARDNAQLLFAAMCASKVYAKDVAVLEIINIRNGSNWRSKATVDTFDLADFENTLRASVARVLEVRDIYPDGIEANIVEGPHCKYCPAFTSCPIKTSLLRQMTDAPTMEPITPENASELYAKYKVMKELTNRVSGALYAFAAEQPIDIGDGRVFGTREKSGSEKLDGDIVFGVLEELLGRDAADAAVKRSATKTGIDKAIKLAKPPGTLKAAKEGILEAVRARGGSKRTPTTNVEEYKPKKELAS